MNFLAFLNIKEPRIPRFPASPATIYAIPAWHYGDFATFMTFVTLLASVSIQSSLPVINQVSNWIIIIQIHVDSNAKDLVILDKKMIENLFERLNDRYRHVLMNAIM